MVLTFGVVEIREYARDISDNPSVSSGIAIGLGWETLGTYSRRVDEFERERLFVRRDNREFSFSGRVDPETRFQICVDAGYPIEEIQHILIDIQHAQDSRIESLPTEYDMLMQSFTSAKSIFFELGKQSLKSFFSVKRLKLWSNNKNLNKNENNDLSNENTATNGVNIQNEFKVDDNNNTLNENNASNQVTLPMVTNDDLNQLINSFKEFSNNTSPQTTTKTNSSVEPKKKKNLLSNIISIKIVTKRWKKRRSLILEAAQGTEPEGLSKLEDSVDKTNENDNETNLNTANLENIKDVK